MSYWPRAKKCLRSWLLRNLYYLYNASLPLLTVLYHKENGPEKESCYLLWLGVSESARLLCLVTQYKTFASWKGVFEPFLRWESGGAKCVRKWGCNGPEKEWVREWTLEVWSGNSDYFHCSQIETTMLWWGMRNGKWRKSTGSLQGIERHVQGRGETLIDTNMVLSQIVWLIKNERFCWIYKCSDWVLKWASRRKASSIRHEMR